MLINIDFGTRTPIYEQIVLEVERLVTKEVLKPGEQIPSIRELALTLSVNPNTIKKAYDILEAKNIIVSKSTKGTFITDNIKKAKNDKIDDLIKKIREDLKELESLGLSKEEIFKKLK